MTPSLEGWPTKANEGRRQSPPALNTKSIEIENKKYFKIKKLYGPFLYMGFNCLKANKPLRGVSLLFTTNFPDISSIHLIHLGSMKG